MIGLLNSAKYNTIIILFLVNVKRLAYFCIIKVKQHIKANIMYLKLEIDEQLADILRAATDLYSKTDKLIETKKYNHEEYPGNKLDEIADKVGSIMCELGDIIGHEIASQAFDAC